MFPLEDQNTFPGMGSLSQCNLDETSPTDVLPPKASTDVSPQSDITFSLHPKGSLSQPPGKIQYQIRGDSTPRLCQSHLSSPPNVPLPWSSHQMSSLAFTQLTKRPVALVLSTRCPVALVQPSDVQFSSYPAHQTSSCFDPAHQTSRCPGPAIRCPV